MKLNLSCKQVSLSNLSIYPNLLICKLVNGYLLPVSSYGCSVSLCVLIFFMDASHMVLDPTLMTSLWLKYYSLSCERLFVTPWTPLSIGFSRQDYWSGLPFPFPEDLPDPGIKPRFPTLQATLYCLSHPGNYLSKDPISKYSHSLRYWLGLQHMNLEGKQLNP